MATWLVAKLDASGFYRAAAYASMTVDAIDDEGAAAGIGRQSGAGGGLRFELDQEDHVWMIRGRDAEIVGRKELVVVEMRRFLAAAAGGNG